MILYLDTSALVKLFADEPDSDRVRVAVEQAEFRACHVIGYAEGCAALARRGRELRLARGEIESRIAEFTRSWHRLDVIAADWPLIQRAGQLAVEHGLRGYDSVHLAAAEAVWTRVRGAADFRFAVFDEGLSAAADRIGMELIAS